MTRSRPRTKVLAFALLFAALVASFMGPRDARAQNCPYGTICNLIYSYSTGSCNYQGTCWEGNKWCQTTTYACQGEYQCGPPWFQTGQCGYLVYYTSVGNCQAQCDPGGGV